MARWRPSLCRLAFWHSVTSIRYDAGQSLQKATSVADHPRCCRRWCIDGIQSSLSLSNLHPFEGSISDASLNRPHAIVVEDDPIRRAASTRRNPLPMLKSASELRTVRIPVGKGMNHLASACGQRRDSDAAEV